MSRGRSSSRTGRSRRSDRAPSSGSSGRSTSSRGGDAEKYAKFWGEFGKVLKEGVIEDAANREAIAALLRFHSTDRRGRGARRCPSPAYVERMNKGQEAIHYLTADSLTAARSSPHLEVFRKRGVEVLLLTDPGGRMARRPPDGVRRQAASLRQPGRSRPRVARRGRVRKGRVRKGRGRGRREGRRGGRDRKGWRGCGGGRQRPRGPREADRRGPRGPHPVRASEPAPHRLSRLPRRRRARPRHPLRERPPGGRARRGALEADPGGQYRPPPSWGG